MGRDCVDWHRKYDDPDSSLPRRLRVVVVCGDASVTSAYVGAVPADLVLLCGIFGNISDADIRATVAMAAAPGGSG